MRYLVVAALLAIALPSSARAGDVNPGKTVAAFYNLYLQEKPRGVPDAAVREKFRPLISRELGRLLDAAAAAEDLHFRKTNNEEPPLVEGDLFSSLFEGATAFTPGKCAVEGDHAYCDADLAYAEPGEAKPTTWTDKVALIRSPQGWLVDDIAFGGAWDFGQHGMLRATLRQVAAYDGE
ncbi:MAG: hypothetical protein K8R18_07700 [Parvibaculum sp.]|uniref:hypothetical protein n=1 Tax=Parvibaculum sp. TaxID=2024848 RepID=UPI0025E2A90E|nr:hypothetical protein [Parvibaculum sp.]MCE9649492.1 hypothetical protein [Parvibaculum sp.]